jgi:hypothetical protein
VTAKGRRGVKGPFRGIAALVTAKGRRGVKGPLNCARCKRRAVTAFKKERTDMNTDAQKGR